MASFRSQQMTINSNGLSEWATVLTDEKLDCAKTAAIVCDVWDHHWSYGAQWRLQQLVEPINAFLYRLRESGILIIHAPSDTIFFYQDSPARKRIARCPVTRPKVVVDRFDPPFPVDDSDGGSDSGEDAERVNLPVWTRQHPSVVIDEQRDVISDSGEEIYSYVTARGIQRILMVGVHANMCILNRTFGIKNLVRWGLSPVLIRDLTDAMYNPAMPPYVSHSQGLELVIGYIEKFWCPSACSGEILRDICESNQGAD